MKRPKTRRSPVRTASTAERGVQQLLDARRRHLAAIATIDVDLDRTYRLLSEDRPAAVPVQPTQPAAAAARSINRAPANTAPVSHEAFQRARQACDESILMALVNAPLRLKALRAATTPFGTNAIDQSLKRLLAAGEIAGEGKTVARTYRLVQRTPRAAITMSPGRRVRSEGIELESVWPLPGNPKAPPSALNEAAR